MRKIRVIRGGCGISYEDEHGTKRNALKTPEDGPFVCDDVQADRLVRLGVATYVSQQNKKETEKEAEGADDQEVDEIDNQEADETEKFPDEDRLSSMTAKQLQSLAGEIGVNVKNCKNKGEMIKVIKEAWIENEEDPEDDPAKVIAEELVV